MLTEVIYLYGVVIGKIMVIAAVFKINGRSIDIKSKDFYICSLIYILVHVLTDNHYLYNARPFLSFLCLILICWKFLKKEFIQSILSATFIYIFMLVLEFIILFLVLTIGQIATNLSLANIIKHINYNMYISFSMNIGFSIILLLLCNIQPVLKVYLIIDNLLYQRRFQKNYLLIIPIFLFIIFSIGVIYYSNNLMTTVSIYFFLLLLTVYVIISNFKISNEYERTKEKYTNTSKSLIEYEEMIDKYRINNHENKNQLQMIRNMIKQKDKFVENYIDNLLDTVYTKNEQLMMDVSIIPAGGLRAAIYSKLIFMDNNNIKHILTIDHKLRNVDFFENNSKLTLKLCNLLSIFIDNAIDEVKLLDEKVINIDIYLDDINTVAFEITNKYISEFDINKICEKKYTTKDKGHGYGLTLAKEIVSSDQRIINNTIVKTGLFTQILLVDITK